MSVGIHKQACSTSSVCAVLQVLALKARHTEQLDLVNTRVQDISARKDETIAALRTELAQLQEQMQQLLT